MIALAQSSIGSCAPGTPAVLPGPPTAGNMVGILTTGALPTGFTDIFGASVTFAISQVGFRFGTRIAAPGETGSYVAPVGEYILAEISGLLSDTPLDPQFIINQVSARAHETITPVYDGTVLVIGLMIQDVGLTLTPDAGYTYAERNDSDANAWTTSLIYRIGPNIGVFDPGMTNSVGPGSWGAAAVAFAGDPAGPILHVVID